MSLDYVRQIVSGNKARFVDHGVDLDLVYVTDRIIIMGYPATGFAALYRNRRRDVLKFINSRHGDKWWIWNLCPLYENAYSPESMSHRVSRYPFPDHHPPPLPLLPLAVREMNAWLQSDDERVAVIHCKAGKGRSGTLLCSYLLSLPELPPPPRLDRSHSRHDQHRREGGSALPASTPERDGWVMVGQGDQIAGVRIADTVESPQSTPQPASQLVSHSVTSSTTTISRPSPPPSTRITHTYDPIDIGDEAEPGTTGQEDRADGRVDEVFKLHSTRRMKPTSSGRGVSIPSQRRWCRYVHLLFNDQAPASYLKPSRIRLVSVTLLLQPPSGWQKPLARIIVGSDAGQGRAWASVARYDDAYVDELLRRSRHNESSGSEITWGGVGGQGVFDTSKMFRSCGKVTAAEAPALPGSEPFHVHHMVPDTPIVLDRSREFRLKFHVASVPLGWTWLIPAFHLPERAASGPSGTTIKTHTLRFPRSQIDFAIGPGTAIYQVLVQLEDLPEDDMEEPTRLLSEEEERREGLRDERGENVKEEGE
ncbi:hypothetical protein BCR39DRAFT_50898 [Naematelia encephala]|uniref:phosphatidylinositol-3,4,5-trisphosphate 3-phosphatase n=1 Tax=Naematelia encephala TaxID=71784 RepID=A0A1Y2AH09_9TREE|nr:hypothetical protein BCR39DRAFT_50898 [Naematelia encephala]